MRKFICGSIVALAGFTSILFAGNNSLSKVEILGREYYCYEVKKDESLYGIARNMGWNEAELSRMNPSAVRKLKAGQKLYYPVEAENTSDNWIDSFPVWHVAQEGETVYSISSLYDVPLDTLYKNNPNFVRGVFSGDTVIIRKGKELGADSKTMTYRIAAGDTPLSVARKFHTTVASLWNNNPTISEDNFSAGQEISVTPDLDLQRISNSVATEGRVVAVKELKIPNNSSWEGIARTNSVDVDVLRAANPDVKELKKNEVLLIPVVETVNVSTTRIDYDPREFTEEGRREIYDSIQHQLSPAEKNLTLPGVTFTVILSKPSSNKDIDFVRGVTTALQEYVDEPFKLNLKVIDGSTAVSKTDLEGSDIVFATYEKDFPTVIAALAESMSIPLVNVFDLKCDYYLTNSTFMQLLPPSDDFNRLVEVFLEKELAGKTIIFVGEPDGDDQIARSVITNFASSIKNVSSTQQLLKFPFKPGKEYAVFSFARKKSDINSVLEAVADLRAANPLSDIETIGRPSWMAYEESLRIQLGKANTCFPSRFYFDRANDSGIKFQSDYKGLFHQNPIKSSPMYSVVGYDVANYFIPFCVNKVSDLHLPYSNKSLQTYMNFAPSSIGAGSVNISAYMLRFNDGGNIEKILLK